MDADADLVTATKSGDVRAFGRLVERHHAAVSAIATAITKHVALGEDIAQETFIVAWTRLGELREPARVRAWLCNIARNLAKNELRKKVAASDDVDVAADAPSPADAIAARETSRELHAILAEIPDTYREPLVLYYWADQSILEVAASLEITEQAAQKRISRGRGFVEAGLAKLEQAARERRPAKAAAAAIVAVLATRAAPAAAAATKGTLMTANFFKLVSIALAVCAIAAIAIVAVYVADDKPAAVAAPAAKQASPTTSSATRAPAQPALAPDHGAGYIITRAPIGVAVNLDGGMSPLVTRPGATSQTKATSRTLRGRVVDAGGKPLANVVVLASASLMAWEKSVGGDAAVTTNTDGEFEVAIRDAQLFAVALHPTHGWSQPVTIAAGKTDVAVEIRVAKSGGLTGRVRRANTGHHATLFIKNADESFGLRFDTDAKGNFALPLLPLGKWTVSATPAQIFAGGTSKAVKREVVLDAASKNLDIDLPTGSLVVVTTKDFDKALKWIEYYLVPASVPVTPDAAALRELGKQDKALDLLLGGRDIDRPAQFHDVAAGTYTLCADHSLGRGNSQKVICKKLVVDKDLIEVELN
jgi:RNA polymerase sigma factor (sigma-70 family)